MVDHHDIAADRLLALRQILRLADSKTGASIRPIGKPAVGVIRDAIGRADVPYIFPGTRKETAAFDSLPKAWGRIVTPVLPGVTPHTLRHSFASVADDLGYSEATIGAMLGHSAGSTTRKYIHKLDPALVSAADRVAERISEMMNGTAQTAEILPLARIA